LQLPDGSFQFRMNNADFALRPDNDSAEPTSWALHDASGELLEKIIYDDDGNLEQVEQFGDRGTHTTTYTYNEHGLLVRQESSPGRVTIGDENQPDIREYDYENGGGTVKVAGHCGGIVLRKETRQYDSRLRPIGFIREEGAEDMGRSTIGASIEYPEAA